MKTKKLLIITASVFFLIPTAFIGGCVGDTANANRNNLNEHDVAASKDQDRIIELESRIAKLEQVKTSKPVSMQGGWQSLDNWSKVKEGMSFDQVTEILGKPTKKDMYGIDSGLWYYEGYLKEAGATVSGKIFFYGRRVRSVEPPVF